LRFKFPRLFDLAVNKDSTVAEMKREGWGEGRGGMGVETSFASMGGEECEGVLIIIT